MMSQSLKMVGLMGWGVAEQSWRKGPWTPEEDKLLTEYVSLHGEGRWSSVSRCAGLNRSGKSCRLRWVNYLRPGLKRGQITPQEEGIIIELHALWGNKWSTIARYLPGRTDNEIKNYWRTHFRKKERSARKTSERRKSLNPKPKPLPPQSQPQLEAQQPQMEETNKLLMELPAVSSSEQIYQVAPPQANNNNNKQQELVSMYTNPTIEEQNLMVPPTTSWMDATCQDQDGLWSSWGSLWNFGDQTSAGGRVVTDQIQPDQYCSKMAVLSLQNQATMNNSNNFITNNGFSWGGDPNIFI